MGHKVNEDEVIKEAEWDTETGRGAHFHLIAFGKAIDYDLSVLYLQLFIFL